jgi:hypothetical protein
MKRIVLRAALTAKPAAADFALVDAERPACPPGGVVGRVAYLSLDPYIGSRLRGRHMGEAPPRPGLDPIPGAVVAQVIETRHPTLRPGDWVHAMDGAWAEEVALTAPRKLDAALAPLSTHVGVLGMPGLTAWAGMTQLAQVGAGDVVLVDAAAGPVGGTVGQIARIKGAKRVVGIAGGPEKCRLVTETYGFDACIDYKAAGWREALAAALPEPVTVHFENVSVAMLTAGMAHLAAYGRVVLCGLVDQYHADGPPAAIPAGLIIGKRAKILGLVVYDFYPAWDSFAQEAAGWLREDRLRIAEDQVQGLEVAPALFERLMNGVNIGKAVVAVSPE